MHLTGIGYTRVDPAKHYMTSLEAWEILNTRRRDNTLEGAPFTSQPICLLHAAVQVEKQRAVRERLQQANTGTDGQRKMQWQDKQKALSSRPKSGPSSRWANEYQRDPNGCGLEAERLWGLDPI